MSVLDDHRDEMPGDDPFDHLDDQDDSDGLDWPDDEDWLAVLAQDVRFAVSGPAPEPSADLARILSAGFSTDNGELLATAVSNVNGPASQVAGLPKWRKDPHMTSGFIGALIARLGAIPTAAKAALATVTALMTMTVAGAAANALPSAIQGPVAGAINAITPFTLPTGDVNDAVNAVAGSVPGGASVDANVSVDLNGDGLTVPPVGNVPGVTIPDITIPNVPGLPGLPDVTIPNVPGLPGLPDVGLPGLPTVPGLPALPACVTNLLPAGGAAPDPTVLIGQLPGCIQEVLGSALPANVSQCVASVLGTLTGVLNPGAIGTLPNLNVSSCIPLDATSCTANLLATTAVLPDVDAMLNQIFSTAGGVQNWAAIIGNLTGNIPGIGALPAGCVPIDVQACLSSISGALGSLPPTGGVPDINLSACMPTGLTSGIPGLGGGIPGLGGIPFFPFQ